LRKRIRQDYVQKVVKLVAKEKESENPPGSAQGSGLRELLKKGLAENNQIELFFAEERLILKESLINLIKK
jgi:hypothetical protein